MKNKFRNPYFYLGLVSIFFAAAGIQFEDLTSWQLLLDALLSILENPVSILAVIGAMLSVWNDNSTSGLDPIKPKHEEANNGDK
jgi:hypothetical protein